MFANLPKLPPYAPVCNVQIHWLHYSSKVSLFELTQRRWTLNHWHITGIKSSAGCYTIMMLFHPINTISTILMDRTTSLSVIYHICHGWMEHKWCHIPTSPSKGINQISAFRSVFVGLLGASIIAGETGSTDSLVTGGPKGVPHDTGPVGWPAALVMDHSDRFARKIQMFCSLL